MRSRLIMRVLFTFNNYICFTEFREVFAQLLPRNYYFQIHIASN